MTTNTQDNVPGTEYLVDTSHNLDASYAGSGQSDIVLLPQPTTCGRDPLVSLGDTLNDVPVANDDIAMVDVEEVLAAYPARSLRLRFLVWR